MSTISIDIVFSAINKAMPAINALDKGFNAINNNLWKVNQAAEAWNKTSQTINQVSAPFRGYNQGMADLESITGITGKELEGLGKTARKTGKESGLGAEGAIEAYKLLAGQIEYSKIGMEGLNDLHSKTITLSQASGLSLQGSANAMAGTINQFGLAAGEANRVINVLAAGSKYGAAEIPDLAQSFKVAGASAAAAGLSVESTAGALEVLSQMNIKGSEAGTALRNVLLKLQTELGVDLRVTKLSDALAALQPKMQDATFMAKTFGAENIAAAQFLAKNASAVEEMTQQVTGTNTAFEQASIRNKTFTHWLDVKRAKMNDLSIAFFQHNEGLLKGVMATGQMAAGMTSLLPLVGGLGKGFTVAVKGAVATAKAARLMSAAMAAGKVGTYSDLIARYGMAGKMAAVGIKISTIAQGAWNAVAGFTTATMVPLIASTWAWTAALLANPITWIVVGVGALIAGLVLAWKHFDGFRGAVVGAWEGIKQFGVILWQSIITPLKQIIGGIGAVGKAIGLMFKGKFGEAAATAKEGFANIAEGAVKATPAGVALEVVSRRKEIVDKAAAGYEKGKAMKPGASTNKATGAMTDTTSGLNGQMFAMPKQGLNSGSLQAPMSIAWNKSNQPESESVSFKPTPESIDAKQPSMKVVKAPGMVDPIAVKQPAAVTVPGAVAMQPLNPLGTLQATPEIGAMPQVPGMDVAVSPLVKPMPAMKVVKAPGMVDPLSVKQPAAVNVPANMAMQPLNPLKGTLQATTEIGSMPQVPGMNIPATIDAQQPTAKPMIIPGIVSITTPKIEALNISGDRKTETGDRNARTSNIEALTRNITTNISKNEIKNQTANQTNNDSTAKIEVTYSPVINISSAMDQRATDDLMKMLAENKDELMKLINEEMRRNNRLRYAG